MQINQATKRFFFGVSWALSLVAATYSGYWFAADSFATLLSTSALSREIVEAIQTQNTLEKLDNGTPEIAREGLRLRMDGHILALANFSEYSASEKDRETSNKLLRRVAAHRKNHQSLYSESPTSEQLRQANAMIEQILKNKETNR